MALLSNFWRISPLLIVLFGFILASSNSFKYVDIDVLRSMPYLLSAVLLLFAGMFNQSRFIAPILITFLAYLIIREKLQASLSDEDVMTLFVGANLVFCCQLILSAVTPEKGLFTRTGLVFITLILSASLVLLLHGDVYDLASQFLNLPQANEHVFIQHYWMSNALVLVHLVTLVILLVNLLVRRDVADQALVLTWIAGAIVFFNFALPEASSICFSALLIALFVLFQQSNYRVTFMDALTGIPGRRSLEDYLSTLGKKYSIAMLDVDHFKKFNDTYGHDVGDQVLRMVASKIVGVQGGGKAFRYGGEEFTIVFNRRYSEDAFVFLEAVRESIKNYQMMLRSDDRSENIDEGKKQRGRARKAANTVSVTISIGVADSQAGLSPKDIIKSADEKLYQAKKAGRNCTIK